jgi:hypothetical protein
VSRTDDSSSIVHVGAGTVRLRARGPRPADAEPPPAPRVSHYGRWRAAALTSVYVLMGLHIAHWKLNGTTLAPLELNEVMHTLELGIITAGFIFMAVAFLGTLVFGRFFCSWACHILALEDLCAWLLARIGIHPKPLRSRVLLLVPPIAFLYMFVWPQIERVLEGRPLPELRVLSEGESWASFVTSDFWRNLPDPWIAGLTFAVCGFAIVYVLGSRSFCRYACPYGAVFAFADRLAPGRIKLTGQCEQCGHCTATCSSQVRVHEEIAEHGMVVDSSCMKDLDCVGGCPHQAITFGFARPALLDSFRRTGRRRLSSDFSLGEEGLAAVVFIATIVVFRGLYHAVPFLMTLGLGAILAYGAVMLVRLARRPNVRLAPFQLRRSGRLTPAGRVAALVGAALVVFTAHSAFIRYHEAAGRRAYLAARAAERPPAADVRAAMAHLELCERWGLFRPVALHETLADLHLMANAPDRALPHLVRVLDRKPDDHAARHALVRLHSALGERLAGSGRLDDALPHLRAAVELSPESGAAHANLGLVLGETGALDEAVEHLERAIELEPGLAPPHFMLGRIAEHRGDLERAWRHYFDAARNDPFYADLVPGAGD